MSSHQKTYTWLLLAVMLAMQAINAFHIHEPQVSRSSSNDYCDMCAHHVKHYSHISGEHYHMHPCLLCQISSSQYVTLQTAPTWTVQRSVITIDCPQTFSLPVATTSQRQSRAPPVV